MGWESLKVELDTKKRQYMQRKKYMHVSFFRHIFTWRLKIPITPIKSTIYGFFFLLLPYVPINCWGGGYSCRILAFCNIYKNLSIQASYIQEADKDIPWSLYLNNFSPKFFYQNSLKHTWIYMYMYISTNSITST